MSPTISQGLPGNQADPFLEIRLSIRALILPSPALYYECNRERLQEHAEKLVALDLELGLLRKRAFAAGTRLLALRRSSVPTPGGRHELTH